MLFIALIGGGLFNIAPETPARILVRWKEFEGMRKRAKRHLRKEKGNMALKSVESQNVEFKSNWRGAASDV